MEQVDINMDETTDPAIQPETNTTAVVDDGQPLDRPEWLPEKFQSPEAMAEAYQNLERRLSQGEQPEPVAEDAALSDLKATPTSVTSEALTQYTQEYMENGVLSDESYSDLSTKGIDRTAVDSYISGQRALVEQNLNQVYSEVGGQQEYVTLIDWATKNLQQGDIDTFNEAVQSTNPNGTLNMPRAMFAIKGLKAQREGAEGRQPQLLQGAGGSATGNAFKSTAQVIAAMQDGRYEKDPAYRQEVQDRLAVSDVFN
jgi:hypothetical protein